MTVCFRTAFLADVPAIRALVESAYRGDSARGGWTHEADLLSGERTSDDELAGMIADPAQRIVLAEREGALVGSVAITSKPPQRCYLGMLAVAPGLQAAGLGRQLIDAAEAAARETFGAAVMEMTVIHLRPELIGYYERRGYVRTGELRPFPYVAPETAHLDMVVLERALS